MKAGKNGCWAGKIGYPHHANVKTEHFKAIREETGSKCQIIDGHGRGCTHVCVIAALCVFRTTADECSLVG